MDDDIIVSWEGPTITLTPEDETLVAWEDDGAVLTFEAT